MIGHYLESEALPGNRHVDRMIDLEIELIFERDDGLGMPYLAPIIFCVTLRIKLRHQDLQVIIIAINLIEFALRNVNGDAVRSLLDRPVHREIG